MTHRLALVLSIVLTLVVATGVLAGRDRLFAPEQAGGASTVTTEASASTSDTQAGQLTPTSPRIVTVTLPAAPSSNSGEAHSERSERGLDLEGDDHGHDGSERYEHDGEYDDD